MEKNTVIVKEDSIVIEKINDFELEHVFDCGQCFRWTKEDDGSYTGVAFGKLINIDYIDSNIIIKNSSKEDYDHIWEKYLDLKRDYSKIKKDISKDNNIMKEMIDFGSGIRLLNQDEWEATISFIISQNRSIPLIKKSIEMICEKYGNYIQTYRGKDYYTFPTPDELAVATIEEIEGCKVGYRAKYIVETAKEISKDSTQIYSLKDKSYEQAKEYLLSLLGVGPKVANCITLFAMEKYSSFPIDVWIKRTMENFFELKGKTDKEIMKKADEMFGQYGGFAQQYLFYFAINQKK